MSARSSSRAARAVEEPARAKINLSLKVLGRRTDGYHELETLVAFAEIGDSLSVGPADGLRLILAGEGSDTLPEGRGNLAFDAAELLLATLDELGCPPTPPGARLGLTRCLPVSSGIGGGSADAAATLRALMKFWEVPAGTLDLERLALRLGADVPMCLVSRPALVTGIGETCLPVPEMPELPAVLVNPRLPVATAEVFGALNAPPLGDRAAAGEAPGFGSLKELVAWLGHRPNDLEAPATALHPEIAAVKVALAAGDDALLIRMSGSGATCFALYRDDQAACAAARRIAAAEPAWWVVSTRLSGCG